MRTLYSSEIAAALCARIARGETLAEIVRAPGMPSRRTVSSWLTGRPEFAAQYRRAKEARTALGIATTGRPTDYSPELVMQICDRMLEGQSLRRICAAEGMPTRSVVLEWLARHPEFRVHYAWAREIQLQILMDEVLEIVDDPTLTPSEKRVRMDGRKVLVAIMMPKKYVARPAAEPLPGKPALSDTELDTYLRAQMDAP